MADKLSGQARTPVQTRPADNNPPLGVVRPVSGGRTVIRKPTRRQVADVRRALGAMFGRSAENGCARR